MRSIYFILFVILSGCAATPATNAALIETSEIILPVLNNLSNDEHSCERAVSMSEGALNEQECMAALPKAKELCGEAVNNYVGLYVATEDQARYVARTIYLCKIWTLLGYETITTEGGVQYVVKPGGGTSLIQTQANKMLLQNLISLVLADLRKQRHPPFE